MKIKLFMIRGGRPRNNIAIDKDWPQWKKDQYERMNAENRGVRDTVYAVMEFTTSTPIFRDLNAGVNGIITSNEKMARSIFSRMTSRTSSISDVYLVETHMDIPDWEPRGEEEEPYANQAAVDQI